MAEIYKELIFPAIGGVVGGVLVGVTSGVRHYGYLTSRPGSETERVTEARLTELSTKYHELRKRITFSPEYYTQEQNEIRRVTSELNIMRAPEGAGRTFSALGAALLKGAGDGLVGAVVSAVGVGVFEAAGQGLQYIRG